MYSVYHESAIFGVCTTALVVPCFVHALIYKITAGGIMGLLTALWVFEIRSSTEYQEIEGTG